MRRPSTFVSRGAQSEMDVAMTPLIDVVFLLLVFFVCTVSFQLAEYVLPAEVSAQTGRGNGRSIDPLPEQDFENVVVRIGWDGQSPTWKINDQPVESIKEVSSQLRAISEIKTNAPLILHPDPPVPLGHVIEAYDAAKLAGFEKVSFAVNTKSRL